MSKDTLIDIRDFIHDDTVASFITNHVNVLMPWESFYKEPMPLDLPPETMWEVVEFVRLTGSSFQMPLSRTVDET